MLLAADPWLALSVSPPRDDRDAFEGYTIISSSMTIRCAGLQGFPRWALFWPPLRHATAEVMKSSSGCDVLLDIDWQELSSSNRSIRTLAVFILPPSNEELDAAAPRVTDSADVIASRMARARPRSATVPNMMMADHAMPKPAYEGACILEAELWEASRRPWPPIFAQLIAETFALKAAWT